MARKVRTWKCPCCGVVGWTRTKTSSERSRYMTCRTCAVELVAARTYSTPKNCVHRRQVKKTETFVKRMGTKPRTRAQRVLVLTPGLKSLWAEVRKAKTKPAMQRRGQKFLEALAEHVRVRPTEDTWTVSMNRNGQLSKHWGGAAGVPEIVLKDRMPGLHGQYVRALFDGVYEIRLNTKSLHPDPVLAPIESLRCTFVHELCHWLDSEAGTDFNRGHDRLWDQRLNRLSKLLPFTQYGSPSYDKRMGNR